MLDHIEIDLRGKNNHVITVHIDVAVNGLARKWLAALNHLIAQDYALEKNYCFMGFAKSDRSAEYICQQINASILAINESNIGYDISDHFTMDITIATGPIGDGQPGMRMIQSKMNQLHRYFEDLQGHAGSLSPYYIKASPEIRWHIRQLNLLCHEYESLLLSLRKATCAPAWQRPSQLMCWLKAPRFELSTADYELFGLETISRQTGGVYVGVNKAVGKHHWEVFCDEGRNSRIDELTTTSLRAQTLAAGDFDIEWGQDPGPFDFQKEKIDQFRAWLISNQFDPEDPALTIGHPKVAQVDLIRSFGTVDPPVIWHQLTTHLDVYKIRTSTAKATYNYRWSDADFAAQQIRKLYELD